MLSKIIVRIHCGSLHTLSGTLFSPAIEVRIYLNNFGFLMCTSQVLLCYSSPQLLLNGTTFKSMWDVNALASNCIRSF